MKILFVLLACLVVGCNQIDEIVITVDQEIMPGVFTGTAFVEVDGDSYHADVRFNVPILTRDLSEVSVPYTPPERGHIAVPDDVDEVWVTPHGSKFHWACWRTDDGAGEWVSLDEALGGGYDACGLCLDKSAVDRW